MLDGGFKFESFEITKREILASVSIVAVMILIGVLISFKISEHQVDQNEIYNKAVKIESQELFRYGMDTNIGNAFVYGELKVIDPVTYPEIGGKYMRVAKIKEKYTKHTRTVTYTTGSGKNKKTHTKQETYWTWDEVDRESIQCKKISFCGVKFKSNKIIFPSSKYIETIKESRRIRYKYYGVSEQHIGTIFADLRNKTIPDKTHFYKDMNIEKTVDYLESGDILLIFFWFVWIILIVIVVFIFYYADNEWLK